MEEKKTLKISLSTFLLFIAIIIIIVMGIYIYIEKFIENAEIVEFPSPIGDIYIYTHSC